MSNITWTETGMEGVFSSLEDALKMKGVPYSKGRSCRVTRVEKSGIGLFIKKYTPWGKKRLSIRFQRHPAHREKQNLEKLKEIGIRTPKVLGWGHEPLYSLERRGVLITEEIPQTRTVLDALRSDEAPYSDPIWQNRALKTLAADITHMHRHHFIHGDLKLRNILISLDPDRVYFIDTTSGRTYSPIRFRKKQVKEMAYLEKVTRDYLSPRQRLKFFKHYMETKHLQPEHRRLMHDIIQCANKLPRSKREGALS